MLVKDKAIIPEIIFADDVEKTIKQTSEIIREFGRFRIDENIGGAGFIDKFKKADYDLSIVDLKMPNDGLRIVLDIRKFEPVHPIIIYTAHLPDYIERIEEYKLVEDLFISIIQKDGRHKVMKTLVPRIIDFTNMSISQKLRQHLSNIYITGIPTRIQKYFESLEFGMTENLCRQNIIFHELARFLNSTEVWNFYQKKGQDYVELLILLRIFIRKAGKKDFSPDILEYIKESTALLNTEKMDRTRKKLLEARLKEEGVFLLPHVHTIDELIEAYRKELFEEED